MSNYLIEIGSEWKSLVDFLCDKFLLDRGFIFKVTYHFKDFVLTRQSRGPDFIILNVPAVPVDVGDRDGGCQDDQDKREEETKSEEEDVVRSVFWPGARWGATHPILF